MSRKNIIIIVAVLVLIAAGAGGYVFWKRSQDVTAAATPEQAATMAVPSNGTAPIPMVLVLDRAAVLRISKAGQDMSRQIQAYVSQARSGLDGQRASLESQARQLEQDTGMAAAARQQRINELTGRQQALQAQATRKEAQLSATASKANADISKVAGEIVGEIVKERGANMVLDRAAVPQAGPEFDITQEVVQKLDAKLPSMKVTLADPPK